MFRNLRDKIEYFCFIWEDYYLILLVVVLVLVAVLSKVILRGKN